MGVGFTPKGAKRVAAAVVGWERGTTADQPPSRPRNVRDDDGEGDRLCRTTSEISAATGLLADDRGEGTAIEIDLETGEDVGEEFTLTNPGFDPFDPRSVVWFQEVTEELRLIKSVFCKQHPEIEEEE